MRRLAGVLEKLERSRLLLGAIFVVWCVVTLVTVFHHEPWRDEADSWLMARDRSLPEIWHIMKYAGTPMLLYVVEMPLAKLGLPYWTEPFINWPVAAAAIALLLFRSPLSLVTRVAAAFSYFLVYEYPVLVRGYALTVFFTFLLAHLWSARRNATPAQTALVVVGVWGAANATAFGLFFAVAYVSVGGLEFLCTRALRTRHNFAMWFASGLGILVAVAQLLPQPKDGAPPQVPSFAGFVRAFYGSALPSGMKLSAGACTAIAVAAAVCTLWLARKSWKSMAVYALYFASLSYLFGAKHTGFVRHWGFYLIAIIAALWMAYGDTNSTQTGELRERKPIAIVSLVASLVVIAVFGAWISYGAYMVKADYTGKFSNAKAMAAYLIAHHLDQRDLAGHSATTAEAVLPYLPRKTLYYPGLDAEASNMNWDHKQFVGRSIPWAEVVRRMRHHFPEHPDDPDRGPLLLTGSGLRAADQRKLGLKLVHAEEHVISPQGENFYLYGPDGEGDRLDPSP